MVENLVAYHCAPALAGIKTANIASFVKSDTPNVRDEIDRLNAQLGSRGICLEVLCECDKRVLVMAYRKKVLAEHLKKAENRRFLMKFGYSPCGSIEDDIARLRTRLTDGTFPHEIGVFLGYPLYDIYCFIKHRDQGCRLCGEWRVYHDADYAQKLFDRYKNCRNALKKRVDSGRTLAQIFCA